MMNMKDIEAAITAKVEKLRARKLSEEYITQRYDHYYALYKNAVLEHNGMSVDYYITFKAYETVAKERDLL